MKYLIGFLLLLFICSGVFGQGVNIYNPDADAKAEIKQALDQAQKEGKHVFLQIGGNWCPWCIKFHRFVQNDAAITTFVDSNFVTVKLNYSKENKNFPILKSLDYPQRFGFPVFVVLDSDGKRIHTQNSAYLEEDGSYSQKKVLSFFEQWSPKALDPANYED